MDRIYRLDDLVFAALGQHTKEEMRDRLVYLGWVKPEDELEVHTLRCRFLDEGGPRENDYSGPCYFRFPDIFRGNEDIPPLKLRRSDRGGRIRKVTVAAVGFKRAMKATFGGTFVVQDSGYPDHDIFPFDRIDYYRPPDTIIELSINVHGRERRPQFRVIGKDDYYRTKVTDGVTTLYLHPDAINAARVVGRDPEAFRPNPVKPKFRKGDFVIFNYALDGIHSEQYSGEIWKVQEGTLYIQVWGSSPEMYIELPFEWVQSVIKRKRWYHRVIRQYLSFVFDGDEAKTKLRYWRMTLSFVFDGDEAKIAAWFNARPEKSYRRQMTPNQLFSNHSPESREWVQELVWDVEEMVGKKQRHNYYQWRHAENRRHRRKRDLKFRRR